MAFTRDQVYELLVGRIGNGANPDIDGITDALNAHLWAEEQRANLPHFDGVTVTVSGSAHKPLRSVAAALSDGLAAAGFTAGNPTASKVRIVIEEDS